MKHLNTAQKFLIPLACLFLLNACSTLNESNKNASDDKKKTQTVSDIGKDELKGEVDERLIKAKIYTKNNSLLSAINKDRVKEKCKFDQAEDSKDWGKMLRIGFACAQDKNWQVVYKIGQVFSVEHIDAPWGAYFMSLVSEEAGNMPRAMWMIGLANRKSPNNAVIEWQKARMLWKQNQKDASFHSAKRALELEPNLSEAALLMAQVYFSDYEFAESEKYFKRVLDKNPKVFTASLGMAESLAQQDKFAEAVPFFISSIRLEKSRIDLAYRVADIYDKNLKDYKKSLVWYQKIMKSFPKEIISKEKKEVSSKVEELIAKIEEIKNPKQKEEKVAIKKSESRNPASEEKKQEATEEPSSKEEQ